MLQKACYCLKAAIAKVEPQGRVPASFPPDLSTECSLNVGIVLRASPWSALSVLKWSRECSPAPLGKVSFTQTPPTAGKIPWDYYPNFVSPLLVHLSQSLRFNAYSWFIHLFYLKRTLILKSTFVSTIHWFSTIKMSTTQRNLMWLNYKILQNSILKKIIWSQ